MASDDPPRFIQISTVLGPQGSVLLYALDAMGQVWRFWDGPQAWRRISDKREEG